MFKSSFTRPNSALQLYLIYLCFNELISNLFHARKIRVLLLKHHQYHSKSRRWNFSSLFFAVVQTGPLQISITNKMRLFALFCNISNWIMAFLCIWPAPLIIRSSPYLATNVIRLVHEHQSLQINWSINDISLLKFSFLRNSKCVIVEFQLEAINAIELLPILSITCSILPSPVKILDTVYFFFDFYHRLIFIYGF